MADRKGRSSWWKWGCAGCAGLLVMLVLVAVAVLWMARSSAESQEVESRVLEPELPPAPAPAESGSDAGPSPGPGPAVPAVPASAAGRVVLDLSGADFHIEPAPEGEPLRIEAKYDVQTYELEESLDTAEDVAWVYRASFRRKGTASFLTGVKELLFGGRPEVHVLLPRDVPMDLRFKLERGGTEMNLGGLWVRSADLEFLQGGFSLEVSEPLREPMTDLSIHGSMGGFAARRLGNASPERLRIDVSMGGMSIDLRGQWRNDSELTVRTSMGGGALRLPRDVAIEGLDLDHAPPRPEGEVKLPTLRFTPESRTKDLEIED